MQGGIHGRRSSRYPPRPERPLVGPCRAPCCCRWSTSGRSRPASTSSMTATSSTRRGGCRWASALEVVWGKVVANYEHLGPFRPVLWCHWELAADLLGGSEFGWRLTRLVWCGLATLMLLWLFAELRMARVAALAAAAIAMWNPYRNEIWTSLTLSEGVAMPYALLALVCACRAPRPPAVGLGPGRGGLRPGGAGLQEHLRGPGPGADVPAAGARRVAPARGLAPSRAAGAAARSDPGRAADPLRLLQTALAPRPVQHRRGDAGPVPPHPLEPVRRR